MAGIDQISELVYERVWTNESDFPTYEPDEEQVRADFQYHPDAIRTYVNTVILAALRELNNGKMGAEVYDPGNREQDIFAFATGISPFVAIQGSTVVSDIEAAHTAGRPIVLRADDGARYVAACARVSDSEYVFMDTSDERCRVFAVTEDGWSVEEHAFTAKAHALSHAAGGGDAIAPGDIGAPSSEDVIVKGSGVEYTPQEDYDPATKKYVDDVAANFAMGTISDKSISEEKLAFSPATLGENGKLKNEQIPETLAEKSETVEVVLSATGWVGTAAPYYQTVTCEIMTPTANGVVRVSESANSSARAAARDALLHKTEQTFGGFTVLADGVLPDVDIPVAVLIVG